MGHLAAFFGDNLPGAREALLVGLPSLLWAWACLRFAGWLKLEHGVRTGYTRKVFHFAIFTSAAGVQAAWGLSSLFAFGAAVSLVIGVALVRGDGSPLYEALAREADAPRRTAYIVAPYFATLIGGLASNLLFGPAAVVGYLVTGLGDAVGEPVGTRFGRHRYAAPGFGAVRATRSLEGSAAVLAVSTLAVLLVVATSPELSLGAASIGAALAVGTASALVEALSPHGWDNATMQVVPSFLGALLLFG